MWLKNFLSYWKKRLFCKEHEYYLVDQYFGDAINFLNARSLWLCVHCKKPHFSMNLNRPEEAFKELRREPSYEKNQSNH